MMFCFYNGLIEMWFLLLQHIILQMILIFEKRNTKVDGNLRKIKVLHPKCISDHNQDMNGVHLSDQMCRMYSVQ